MAGGRSGGKSDARACPGSGGRRSPGDDDEDDDDDDDDDDHQLLSLREAEAGPGGEQAEPGGQVSCHSCHESCHTSCHTG